LVCFDASVISGISCKAWRSEAEASENLASFLKRAPKLRWRSLSSGVGVAEASSGLTTAAFLSFGRVGNPSASITPE